jgi:hypothetical protein
MSMQNSERKKELTVRITLLASLALAGLSGCAREGGLLRVDDQRQPVNRWTIETTDDESVANAVIAQHTLYPYHFVVNGADLNELGERDVKILARHLSRYPGELNLRRGSENQAMYDARIQGVTSMLVAFGVDKGGIKVVDKVPGGDGVSSERALEILERSMVQTATEGGQAGGANGNQNSDKGAQR